MKVFLSHAAEDSVWADRLRNELKRQGLSVWDPNLELFPGDNWRLEAGRALEQADALIVLLSPSFAESSWARAELEYALGQPRFKNRVIPVEIQSTREAPWILDQFQWVHGEPMEAAQRIAKALGPVAA